LSPFIFPFSLSETRATVSKSNDGVDSHKNNCFHAGDITYVLPESPQRNLNEL
jgi:hypothetical protein